MIENKILEIFYEFPEKEFTIREIVKHVNIPRATVHKYIVNLKKQNLVTKYNKANNTLLFKTKKINFFIERIVGSGLLDEIINKLNPSCIILFGSIRKGDSVKESDIDLFVESSLKKELDIKKYEKRLKHSIQLIIQNDLNKLQPNLFNNIINGIKLYGNFNIK
jgi:predicted nucleotidyltransferase/predicted transcriptional regulator